MSDVADKTQTTTTPGADGNGKGTIDPPFSEQSTKIAGVLGEFSGPAELKAAAKKVHAEGYTLFDAHSPFPIHGMDPAMGIQRTRLPFLVLLAGIAGGLTALLLQWWTNAVEIQVGPLIGYAINISGKPLFSLPANIPVTFELIVLFAAFATFFGVIVLCDLPKLFSPWLSSERFKRATTDGFFISIEVDDPKFDVAASHEFLLSIGASAVEEVPTPAQEPKLPLVFVWAGAAVALLALIPPMWIWKERVQARSDNYTFNSPRIHPIPDMDFQPKYKAQSSSILFADRRSNRLPVEGTVAVGEYTQDDSFYTGMHTAVSDNADAAGGAGNGSGESAGGSESTAAQSTPAAAAGQIDPSRFVSDFPEEIKQNLPVYMKLGREQFDIYCAVCHGVNGEGNGIVSQRAIARQDAKWVKPLSIHAETVRTQPVGQIFHSITNGVRSMPAYRSQITPEKRWAIVLYVKALQRSQHATLEDVPEDERVGLRPLMQRP